jgi:hypothetical protein
MANKRAEYLVLLGYEEKSVKYVLLVTTSAMKHEEFSYGIYE